MTLTIHRSNSCPSLISKYSSEVFTPTSCFGCKQQDLTIKQIYLTKHWGGQLRNWCSSLCLELSIDENWQMYTRVREKQFSPYIVVPNNSPQIQPQASPK